jgi:RNA polymerase sigma factor (sigma-70 family)
MVHPNKHTDQYYHNLQAELAPYKNRATHIDAYIHLTDLEHRELLWSNKTVEEFFQSIQDSVKEQSNLENLNQFYAVDDLRKLSLEYCNKWQRTPPNTELAPIKKSYALDQHQGAKIHICEIIVPYPIKPGIKANRILGISIHVNIGFQTLSPLETLLKENAQLKNQIELAQLTPKEREVLQLIAQGLSTQEIAEKLQKSKNTIETHRKRILSKLNCKNMAELTHFAVNSGLY